MKRTNKKLKVFKKKYLKIVKEEAFNIKANKYILNEKEQLNLKSIDDNNNLKINNAFSLINDINADLDDIDIYKIIKKKQKIYKNDISENQEYNTINQKKKKNKDKDTVNYDFNNTKNKHKKFINNNNNDKNPFYNNMYLGKSKNEENKEYKNCKSNKNI